MAMTAPALFFGHPRFQEPDLSEILRTQGPESAWREAFRRHGPQAPNQVQGDFAVAFSPAPGKIFMAVDRFARHSLCYRIEDASTLLVAARADEVAASPLSIDMQAIHDYFHFHVIPAPRTIFQQVLRLPAAHYGLFQKEQLTVAPYWVPRFTSADPADFSALKEEFLDILHSSVQSQCHDSGQTGCFLSGGTDSSTVAGVLTQHLGEGVPTYSIGFDAEGYDEMAYARIAARHFKTRHHEYYVTPEDLVQGIPRVAAYYDQPFGNSSALPGFYCAQQARQDGIQRLLAGDGGDELFGGNSRYAKQKLFHAYTRLPSALRRGLLEPLAPLFNRLPLVRKLGSYIDQARIPMPDRITAYGLLEQIGTENIFSEQILSRFSPLASRTLERTVWRETGEADFVNQMLAYDWRFTLAENDLPKVCGTSALAGIEVGFPLLDERLVDFSLKLPPHYKVNGLKLRWFFKEALRGFLPDEIITKQKHGFGLPFGVWVLRHPPLHRLAESSLQQLAERGLIRPAFVDRLLQQYLPAHPGFYGEMVWILLMLEQWFQAHANHYQFTPS
ncbi:MAG: asparagine synthase, partial [Ferrovum sp.]|nr:asparagine synthase [Ferrovum sp.]